MQIVRNYAKRETEKSAWGGEIGRVVLETDATVIKLNGKPVAEEGMEHLLYFALQSFLDAYAGATSLDEAIALHQKKVDAVIAGTIGQRAGGTAVSEETRIARQIMRAELKRQLGGKSPKWVAFIGLDDDEQFAKLDAMIAKNAAAIAPAVAAKMEELRKEKARLAAMAGAITIEL